MNREAEEGALLGEKEECDCHGDLSLRLGEV